MKLFVLAQALDNESEDLCVLNQTVHAAGEAGEVQQALARVSEVMRVGVPTTIGRTGFRYLDPHLVVQLATSDTDTQGRPAPLLALFHAAAQTHEIEAAIQAAADQLERHPAPGLPEDLEAWQTRGKGRRSHLWWLRPLGRYIKSAVRSLWIRAKEKFIRWSWND